MEAKPPQPPPPPPTEKKAIHLDPVVQRPISANPGLNFNPGFYISLFKSRFGIILPIVLGAFNYQIVVKKKKTELALQAFRFKIKFHTNPRLS